MSWFCVADRGFIVVLSRFIVKLLANICVSDGWHSGLP